MTNELNFDQYSTQAHSYAEYIEWTYPFFALVEEIGELYRHESREARGDGETYLEDYQDKCKKELGDVLWNLNELCIFYGTSLAEVAQTNLDKLDHRNQCGTIKGEGDDR